MKLYEKEIFIPAPKNGKNLIEYFSKHVTDSLSSTEFPIRFAVTKTDNQGYHCELGVLSNKNFSYSKVPSIFEFKKRSYEKNDKFNVALVIPTGIDAVIGGHAGDAGALARYLAGTCDTLITHPNVVNASDINEMTDNTLYVEGSILSRLMMGTIGLQKVRSNNLGVIIDKHDDVSFTHAAINSVNAARTTMGISVEEVVILGDRFKMKSLYSNSGRAVGEIQNLESLCEILESRKIQYDAVALSSVIDVDPKIRESYYRGGIVNPWGGVEAMLTHAISSIFNIPTAHSPMGYSKEEENIDLGVVDPRMAAEVVSMTYLHCILKGLHKSPKIITNPKYINHHAVLNASDINCLVIPDKCLGLPVLAALEQDIPVIAVKDNKNIMENNLESFQWLSGQLIIVDNYLEAVGVMNALKSGVSIESVRRPLKYTRVIND